jgi:hypothetical protein
MKIYMENQHQIPDYVRKPNINQHGTTLEYENI